jgi:hypothetical protein
MSEFLEKQSFYSLILFNAMAFIPVSFKAETFASSARSYFLT